MIYFLQDESYMELEEGHTHYDLTDSYIELIQNLDELIIVTYLIFHDPHSLLVALCWDESFDSLELNDKDDLKNLADTYPQLAQLIRNGINQKYSEGALIRMEDFDNGQLKWFIVSVAENVDIKSLEDLFKGGAQKAATTALERSFDVLIELANNKPKYSGVIWRSFKKGFMMGMKRTFQDQLKQSLSTLFNSPGASLTSPKEIINKKTFSG